MFYKILAMHAAGAADAPATANFLMVISEALFRNLEGTAHTFSSSKDECKLD